MGIGLGAYLGGCWIIFRDVQELEHFMASRARLFSVAALALLLLRTVRPSRVACNN